MKEENTSEKIIDATKILNDLDIERILIGTYGKSRSAPELIELYGIPVATCYSKVELLKEMGLLHITETAFFPNGRKVEYYTANLDDAYVFYDSGKLKVRFKVVLQMASDFRRRYESSVSTQCEYEMNVKEPIDCTEDKKSFVRISLDKVKR